MSRLAKKPIALPKNVEVKVSGQKIDVKGPKGHLVVDIVKDITVSVANGKVDVQATEKLEHKPFLGLSRSQILNAVIGVSQGFEKKLQLVGVGFKAALKGANLDLSLGFSHPNILEVPKGISISIDKNTLIVVSGVDKQLVGQFAATIRSIRPPEPYKGKGVRYEDEVVRRKAGKTAKK